VVERFQALVDNGDLTGDGRFTISDLPSAIWSLFLAPGDQYQAVLAKSSLGRFLEMSAEHPGWIWSVVLALFSYLLSVGLPLMAFVPTKSDSADKTS
jgi:hypothetical protein